MVSEADRAVSLESKAAGFDPKRVKALRLGQRSRRIERLEMGLAERVEYGAVCIRRRVEGLAKPRCGSWCGCSREIWPLLGDQV